MQIIQPIIFVSFVLILENIRCKILVLSQNCLGKVKTDKSLLKEGNILLW